MKKNINPDYYKMKNGVEVIDVIEFFNLNFSLGCCVKYILRAGKKDETKLVEDLEKAAWYINHEIERIKKK